jgi:hypothetical protein
MTPTTHIEVRHAYVGEVPQELLVGFEGFAIDPEWQWVLVSEGKIVAQLLAANMHGVLLILRVSSLPTAPRGWALTLFRRVLRDCSALGLIGFTTFLADNRPAERRLMRIVSRMGGYLIPCSGVWAAGRLDTRY